MNRVKRGSNWNCKFTLNLLQKKIFLLFFSIHYDKTKSINFMNETEDYVTSIHSMCARQRSKMVTRRKLFNESIN